MTWLGVLCAGSLSYYGVGGMDKSGRGLVVLATSSNFVNADTAEDRTSITPE